jgi:hypothetical protein
LTRLALCLTEQDCGLTSIHAMTIIARSLTDVSHCLSLERVVSCDASERRVRVDDRETRVMRRIVSRETP